MENHPLRYQPGTGRDSPFLFNHDLFIYFKTPLLPDPRIFLVIDFAHKHIVWSCTDFEWCIHCLVDNQLFACFGMLCSTRLEKRFAPEMTDAGRISHRMF